MAERCCFHGESSIGMFDKRYPDFGRSLVSSKGVGLV